MKQWVCFIFILFIACKSDRETDESASAGNINEISIVISDVLWNGEVGDSLRKRLAAPIDGLSQEEPIFTLTQYNGAAFEGDLTRRRNIIVIENSGKKDFRYKQDSKCAPQNVFTITGRTIDDLLEVIDMHSEEIITTIKNTEIAENQKRNEKAGLLDEKDIASRYGISIKVPKSYSLPVKGDKFVWFKKDIPSGNTNILLYTVPDNVIEKNKDMLNNIIKMRDSVGSLYIHGTEADTYMITEEAYSPSFFMTGFNNKSAFETRGNWEMKGDFMNGPFLNYAIRDDKHNCYLIVEGFIYSPSSPKRDLIMELESIIRSIKFL
ncbi:DUF4837 domain-containing protein [Flavobacterium album]|uniref:DUF4837 domain-containing protein n=1 Tax=Flavobacterium album TaxID=2175091 RepID=A0A2S1QVZ5_9FLAO|nr:DUF4837 family protein [Flavobacterium album]AWH84401.1 DUF4837 domain-containing protein [Flavobacterium album]